jgi:glycerol-3-phosphate acyltransferase PlsY
MCALSTIILMAVGYLLGSINTSIIVSRLFYGEDVRNYGSGNAGATNVLRTYGKKSAALTLVGDVLKTVIAVISGRLIGFPIMFFAAYGENLYGISFAGYVAALFCVIGHTFPIYYKFKGGKGVLCAATAIAILSPITFVVLFVLFLIIVIGTKFVSLGSVIAVMSYPLLLHKLEGTSICTILAMMIAALVVYNHRTNLQRLFSGTESKISIGKKDK